MNPSEADANIHDKLNLRYLLHAPVPVMVWGGRGRPGEGGGGGQSAVHEGSEATLGPPQELEVRARSAPDF